MRTPRRIAAVGFDFDHTLGIDNKLERVAFLRLIDREYVRCAASLNDEIEHIDALLARQRSGAFTIDEAVERFARERDATDPPACVIEYRRMCVEMVEEFVIAEPGVRDMLSALRDRGVPYAILTNGWSPLQQRKAQKIGFDGAVLVSSDLGVQKPESEAFAALARALGVPVSETAYVGDDPSHDVAGAIAAGMQGIWFDAEGAAYDEKSAEPSQVIHSLAELAALV